MSDSDTKSERAVNAAVDAVTTAVTAPANAAAAAAKAAEPALKRKYKPRAKRVAQPVAKTAPKLNRKARKTASPRPIRKPAAAAAKAAAPQIEGSNKMFNEAPNWFAGFTTLPGADKVQALFGDAGEKSQDAVRKSQAFAEQLNQAARSNVEAIVESSRIAVTGARDLGQDALASSRKGVEQASAAIKTLAEAKSPTEFFQLQSELVRSSFDRFVSEGSKFTEQLVKLTGEAVQPLSNRASVNAESFNELTA